MFDARTTETLLMLTASIAVLALVVALWSFLKLRKITRATDVLQRGANGANFVDIVASQVREVQAMRSEIASLTGDIATLREEVRDALRHVAVIRYDAFGDMGGRLSFSAAILDDNGDGIVLTSIHGRTETRMYLKGVLQGQADNVSPEETQAITHAANAARGISVA